MQRIAILGLGRMGAAIQVRLRAGGHDVTGWTRSGGGDPRATVEGAHAALLCLFDGPACRQVLEMVRPALGDAVVINTSTVSPAEATDFAVGITRYVHAPVLGSVAAVRAGALTLLVGSDRPVSTDISDLLAPLGTVRIVDGPAQAAALKLVANASLAGGLLALREALGAAAALGLDRTAVLDVLQAGALGGLVAAKRDRLDGVDIPADFTVAALAKDADLLAAATSRPLPAARELEQARSTHAQHDIAAIAEPTALPQGVLAPLQSYINGHATGDPAHFRQAFLPSAHIEGLRDGAFTSWSLDEYCALFGGTPAPDEPTRTRRVDRVEVDGTVATATMTLRHGADTFTDLFLLIQVDGGWRIASKVYHRH